MWPAVETCVCVVCPEVKWNRQALTDRAQDWQICEQCNWAFTLDETLMAVIYWRAHFVTVSGQQQYVMPTNHRKTIRASDSKQIIHQDIQIVSSFTHPQAVVTKNSFYFLHKIYSMTVQADVSFRSLFLIYSDIIITKLNCKCLSSTTNLKYAKLDSFHNRHHFPFRRWFIKSPKDFSKCSLFDLLNPGFKSLEVCNKISL